MEASFAKAPPVPRNYPRTLLQFFTFLIVTATALAPAAGTGRGVDMHTATATGTVVHDAGHRPLRLSEASLTCIEAS